MRVNGEFGVARYSISGGGAELDLSPVEVRYGAAQGKREKNDDD